MKYLISIIIFAVALIATLPENGNAQSQTAQWNQKYTALATDSALANNASKTSKPVTLWSYSRTGAAATQVNYITKAFITVSAYQTNDSVRANVFLLFGNNIETGTLGKDFFSVFIDSLYKGVDSIGTKHTNIKIDVSGYTTHPQLAIKVVGKSGVIAAGNGYLATWRAYFGGVGTDMKLTPN